MPFRVNIVKGISFASNSNFNLAIFHVNFPIFQTQDAAIPLNLYSGKQFQFPSMQFYRNLSGSI